METSAETQDFLASLNMEMETERAAESTCNVCRGALTVIVNGQKTSRECVKQLMLIDRFRVAGIPPSFYGYTLDMWNTKQFQNGLDMVKESTQHKIFARELTGRFSKVLPALAGGAKITMPYHAEYNPTSTREFNSLMCVGGKGSGKSMLAAITAMQAVKSNVMTRYFRWIELVNTLSNFEYRPQQDTLVEQFLNMPFIVIDGVSDPHIGYPNFLLQMDRLFDARLSVQKPIFITATEQYQDFKLGEAFGSLVQSCVRFYLPTPQRPQPPKFFV